LDIPLIPTTLTILGTYTNVGFSFNEEIVVNSAGTVAFLGGQTSNQVSAVDVSNPASMSILDSISSSTQLDNARGMALDEANGVLYVCSWDDDMITSIDVSDPGDLSVLDTVTSADLDQARRCLLVGDVLFVTAGAAAAGRVTAVDVSDPSDLSVISTTGTVASLDAGYGMDYDPEQQRLYVAAINSGALTVIDVSNPASMSVLGAYSNSAHS